MGLFLGPFSGHAVGGGGGAGGPGASAPPPGMGDEAGQRAEVDIVNREPLRLLRTTMNKHKPKFMKIVPPGQEIGSIAPPYVWDGLERDDWEYKLPKPNSLREGEFDTPKLRKPPKPHALKPGGATATAPKPAAAPKPPAAQHQAPRPGTPPQHPGAPAEHPGAPQQHPGAPAEHPAGAAPQPAANQPKPVDPRHARVDAIHSELKQLHQEVQQLLAHQKQLVKQGKQELQGRREYHPSRGSTVTVGGTPGKDFGAGQVITLPEAEEPLGMTSIQQRLQRRRMDKRDQQQRQQLDKQMGGSGFADPATDLRSRGRAAARNAQIQQHHDSGQAKRDYAARPKASLQILQVHKALAEKHARIDQLTKELQQLRQQAHESIGLRDNNLHRLSLLLK